MFGKAPAVRPSFFIESLSPLPNCKRGPTFQPYQKFMAKCEGMPNEITLFSNRGQCQD
jgi:hypothetical protein